MQANHRPPRFAIVISELLIVVPIVSAFWAILLPAVNAARRVRGGPTVFPVLQHLHDANPVLFLIAVPLLVASATGIVLALIRQVLPMPARRWIVWRRPPHAARPVPEPKEDARPAVLAFCCAIASTALLAFSGSHLRVDRTHRRPIITWEGPAEEYIDLLAGAGWLLCVAALAVGIFSLCRTRSRWQPLAVISLILSGVTALFSVLYLASAYED